MAQQGIHINRIASFPVYIVFVHLDGGDLKFKFKVPRRPLGDVSANFRVA